MGHFNAEDSVPVWCLSVLSEIISLKISVQIGQSAARLFIFPLWKVGLGLIYIFQTLTGNAQETNSQYFLLLETS